MSESGGGGLKIYGNMPGTLEAIKSLGRSIAYSKLFKAENPEQGEIFAWECLMRGCTPLELARENHVIHGTLSQRYDSMLAKFHERGGTSKIVTRTSDEAEIELTYRNQTIREKLTWEEAAKEAWPYDKDGRLKHNWATPRARRQMLWARIVSEGVKMLCPEVNYGTYTPEEIQDFEPVVSVRVEPIRPTEPADVSEVKPVEPTPEPVSETSVELRESIKKELERVELQEAVLAQLLVQHGIGLQLSNLRTCGNVKAEQLLKSLQLIPTKMESTDWEPCSAVIQAEIKSILKERKDEALAMRVKSHLQKCGKSLLKDVSQIDAERLKAALLIDVMDLFFAESLQAVPPVELKN